MLFLTSLFERFHETLNYHDIMKSKSDDGDLKSDIYTLYLERYKMKFPRIFFEDLEYQTLSINFFTETCNRSWEREDQVLPKLVIINDDKPMFMICASDFDRIKLYFFKDRIVKIKNSEPLEIMNNDIALIEIFDNVMNESKPLI